MKKGDRQDTASSGHRAGVQSAESFGRAERELRRARDEGLAELDQQPGETVYRDRRGRKLDMLNEFMRQQELADGKRAKIEQAQFEWGRGASAKQQREDALRELAEIADEPFARTADDPKLEKMRKETIREGDPMAQYFQKKRDRREVDPALGVRTSRTGKPLYTGPNPTPNRFGIRPGYRWDAVDRGNGFEHRVLTQINERRANKDDEYKYSVSDL